MTNLLNRLHYILKALTCGTAGLIIYQSIGISWSNHAEWLSHLNGAAAGTWAMYELMNGKLWGHVTLSNDKH